jgi:cobalamin-dependent methionine synthase I
LQFVVLFVVVLNVFKTIKDIDDEYDELRSDYYASLIDRKYLSLQDAREKRMLLDYNILPKPIVPKCMGMTLYKDFPLHEVVPYIDWVCIVLFVVFVVFVVLFVV